METKTLDVTVDEKLYTIKKMPLGRYAELFEALNDLPPEITSKIVDIDKLDINSFVGILPLLLSKSFPNIIKVLSIATGIEVEILKEKCDLEEAIKLVEGIFKVNNYLSVKNALVAAFAKPNMTATETPAIKTG